MTIRAKFAVLVASYAVSGCSGTTNAVLDSVRYAVGSRAVSTANVQLNPALRYLRVTIAGRTALMVLGYTDSDRNGPIEVWYSAQREVLRIQDGRIVGAVGLTSEWRNVSHPPLPKWSAIAIAPQPYKWVRTRDVMPGYRFGVHDGLEVTLSKPSSRTALQAVDPESLTWFEERFNANRQSQLDAEEALPPARYAVDLKSGSELVLYGEQCLSRDVCFAWQRWPSVAQPDVGTSAK